MVYTMSLLRRKFYFSSSVISLQFQPQNQGAEKRPKRPQLSAPTPVS